MQIFSKSRKYDLQSLPNNIYLIFFSDTNFRLQYQSRKRGMLENDLILSTFAKKYLDGFNEEQTLMYDRLINSPSNDWDIFYWIVLKKETPKEFDNEIMDLLKKHAQNDEKKALSQPNLY